MSSKTSVAPGPEVDGDAVLLETLAMRRRVVAKLTQTKIPDADTEDIRVLDQMLSGMERIALGKMRIKVEEQANQTAEGASLLIGQLLTQVSTAQNPFVLAGDPNVIDVPSRVVPVLPETVPPPQLVEGETATAAPQQSYESFVDEHQPNVSQ